MILDFFHWCLLASKSAAEICRKHGISCDYRLPIYTTFNQSWELNHEIESIVSPKRRREGSSSKNLASDSIF